MTHSHHDDCKTAQLHLVGHIQAHGALALVERTSGKLLACSENLGAITALPADRMLQQSFASLVPAPLLAGLRTSEGQGRRRLWHTRIANEDWLVSAFLDGEHVLLEFEHAAESSDFDVNQRFGFLDKVSSFREMQDVAEYLLPGTEGFLNHHFPASDLPENARRLYCINHQHLIADTESVSLVCCSYRWEMRTGCCCCVTNLVKNWSGLVTGAMRRMR